MTAVPDRLTTVVSTKGQVILPKPVRDERHWPAGTRLSVEAVSDGVLLRPLAAFEATDVDHIFGMLGKNARRLSPAEMDAAGAAEAKRRARD